MTSFTWLDYSEHERKQAMEVIDLFREEDTRDELGLGTIRDAFADMLFPGTSTIQTRARYFLFVPWIYANIEQRRIASRDVAQRSRVLHGRLRDGLIAGGEEVGVIGYRKGLHVQRLPSSVYWFGLRTWGIFRIDRSEEDYQRQLDHYYRRQNELVKPDAGESPEAQPANWDLHLPSAPDEFPSKVTFQLTRQEAEYLVDRVANRAPRSLLANLLLARTIIIDESFAWELPQANLNEELIEQLLHAQNFSQTLHGAALLYNLILAEEKTNAELIDFYREEIQQWWALLRRREAEQAVWNHAAFWELVKRQGARVSEPTRSFVDAWLALTRKSRTLDPILRSRSLIVQREYSLKKARARIGNQRALESWRGASGSAQLDYRWNRPVRDIVNDIVSALGGDGVPNA